MKEMKSRNNDESMRPSKLLPIFMLLFACRIATAFILCPSLERNHRHSRTTSFLKSTTTTAQDFSESSALVACLLDGSISDENDVRHLEYALKKKGFDQVLLMSQCTDEQTNSAHVYKFQKATGMLQHISSPANGSPNNGGIDIPKWVPIVSDMETVLISNGWSFLDPDESEPMSAFDVDAANIEGTYKPKWGKNVESSVEEITTMKSLCLSTLG